MRRPHPRFDQRRNAWVTRAGGRLKILAKGPKNAQTEAEAWDAFYTHMAHLGNPVEEAGPTAISLGQLADKFGEWLQREVEAERLKPRTLDYYRDQIQRFLDAVGGNRPAASIKPHELESHKTNWHSVQSIQRLYNWGVQMGHLTESPIKGVTRPDLGQRERVLSRDETVRLLRTADHDFRSFLIAMRHTLARPQEIRALQWKHLATEPVPMFVLQDFKARSRRKDRKTAVRTLLVDDRLGRLLCRLHEKRQPNPDDFVFLNSQGKQWTSNAVRCRMRRLREKAGLEPDENGEPVVAYTLRHTSATQASANGVQDRLLAELMGHTSSSTTQRYQHLQPEHLAEAIQKIHRRRGQ